MTALFDEIIFGPVHSRRLGLSLGVNLLPTHSKICNFDCVYCECGWNKERRGTAGFNKREEVLSALDAKLRAMALEGHLPDVITFAGNGEPTMHPHFESIIEGTIALRDALSPTSKVSVLSNATRIGVSSVRRALLRVDNNILKLDASTTPLARAINHPASNKYSVESLIDNMIAFEGKLIIQSMFLRGHCDGASVDNMGEQNIAAWLNILTRVRPSSVMVYSIDRDTPCPTLEKVPHDELEEIAKRVRAIGVTCTVA